MQINHNLQPSALRPIQRLAQLIIRALHIWIAVSRNYTPVPNWDSHVVESRASHLIEIILGDPRVPVLLQPRLGSVFAELLGKCPLVFCAVAFEERGCDPGLENKPSAGVDASDFLVAIVE